MVAAVGNNTVSKNSGSSFFSIPIPRVVKSHVLPVALAALASLPKTSANPPTNANLVNKMLRFKGELQILKAADNGTDSGDRLVSTPWIFGIIGICCFVVGCCLYGMYRWDKYKEQHNAEARSVAYLRMNANKRQLLQRAEQQPTRVGAGSSEINKV